MNVSDEIRKLSELRQAGALSEQEYLKAKADLLSRYQSFGQGLGSGVSRFTDDVNMWCMMIHLSQFCGFLVPFFGLIVPLFLWQFKKNEDVRIDQHGRIVVNWIITEFILIVVFALLCFILIGYPLLIALLVAGLVFPVVGGVKASQGQLWSYPCSIKVF